MRHAKFLIATKTCRAFQTTLLRLLFVIAVIFGSSSAPITAFAQAAGETLVFPATIQWPRQPGVTWYRLQIGGDETFGDIYQDRRVLGDRVRISDLEPGYYYWRIAPADKQLGGFSRPVRFFVSGGRVMSFWDLRIRR